MCASKQKNWNDISKCLSCQRVMLFENIVINTQCDGSAPLYLSPPRFQLHYITVPFYIGFVSLWINVLLRKDMFLSQKACFSSQYRNCGTSYSPLHTATNLRQVMIIFSILSKLWSYFQPSFSMGIVISTVRLVRFPNQLAFGSWLGERTPKKVVF